MFKRFKIVQSWYRPTHCEFKVYERRALFFWELVKSEDTLEKAQQYIKNVYGREESDRQWNASIPKAKVVEFR